MSEEEAGSDVLRFEERVLFEHCLRSVAGGEHCEHVLYGDAQVTDNRLSAEDIRPHGDARQKFGIGSRASLRRPSRPLGCLRPSRRVGRLRLSLLSLLIGAGLGCGVWAAAVAM